MNTTESSLPLSISYWNQLALLLEQHGVSSAEFGFLFVFVFFGLILIVTSTWSLVQVFFSSTASALKRIFSALKSHVTIVYLCISAAFATYFLISRVSGTGVFEYLSNNVPNWISVTVACLLSLLMLLGAVPMVRTKIRRQSRNVAIALVDDVKKGLVSSLPDVALRVVPFIVGLPLFWIAVRKTAAWIRTKRRAMVDEVKTTTDIITHIVNVIVLVITGAGTVIGVTNVFSHARNLEFITRIARQVWNATPSFVDHVSDVTVEDKLYDEWAAYETGTWLSTLGKRPDFTFFDTFVTATSSRIMASAVLTNKRVAKTRGTSRYVAVSDTFTGTDLGKNLTPYDQLAEDDDVVYDDSASSSNDAGRKRDVPSDDRVKVAVRKMRKNGARILWNFQGAYGHPVTFDASTGRVVISDVMPAYLRGIMTIHEKSGEAQQREAFCETVRNFPRMYMNHIVVDDGYVALRAAYSEAGDSTGISEDVARYMSGNYDIQQLTDSISSRLRHAKWGAVVIITAVCAVVFIVMLRKQLAKLSETSDPAPDVEVAAVCEDTFDPLYVGRRRVKHADADRADKFHGALKADRVHDRAFGSAPRDESVFSGLLAAYHNGLISKEFAPIFQSVLTMLIGNNEDDECSIPALDHLGYVPAAADPAPAREPSKDEALIQSAPVIPYNLPPVYKVSAGDRHGTGFITTIEGRRVVTTAKHVLGTSQSASVQIGDRLVPCTLIASHGDCAALLPSDKGYNIPMSLDVWTCAPDMPLQGLVIGVKTLNHISAGVSHTSFPLIQADGTSRIVHTASTCSGDSGSPVFVAGVASAGKLVGVHTSAIQPGLTNGFLPWNQVCDAIADAIRKRFPPKGAASSKGAGAQLPPELPPFPAGSSE